NRLKFDGVPADMVTAVTGPTGLLICTGSTTSAPPGGGTIGPNSWPASPACRLLFPVVWVGRFAILMLPWVEFEARRNGAVLIESVASIAGSSTGQRKNGAHAPGPAWNS